LKDFTEC